ncbi:WPP domain-interacting tail-anchored protein 2 isoform X1 [Pyrus x bretschneideri]|uniref:WPP domain-interacting tail-anchored protein 2 isoform X1 n=1 Tax=Pyrus x bretschneideri TaxID=225117 RepID=UPI00202E43ED|nr:WPP domain-interacting tail-anchored protein 2 isoform X1 [Pyrus x bretschneideri]XP_048441259.1 WPP domain-interacting tail-anchored protein 2 isoform X1 [Pyrus x bretschneideri]
MEDHAVCDINAGNPELEINHIHERVPSNESGVQELESSMKVLTKVDLDLAYSSEKLANLHVPLMYLLAQQNDLEAMATTNNYILADFVEKVLVFNLLSSILDSEVRELDNYMDNLRVEIVDARQKISSCRHLGELYSIMKGKLNDSEESLKQSRQQISEVKMQSARFQRTVLAFAHENWKNDIAMDLSENSQMSNKNAMSNLRMPRQQRHNLWMLEKSLSRELYLEKKLAESRQNEEELKLKMHHMEEVAFRMEEAAEVVWGRFLEAENAAEVLQGISKELLGRLQLVHFNLNGSIQRESELKFNLQASLEEIRAKDNALHKLEKIMKENIKRDVELAALREKVTLLEKQLKESQLQLKNANATNESSEEKLGEMESLVASLKENIFVAEIKAESAELKVAEVTGTNVELTEELNFLKGSATGTEKKVGSLEKQLREVEIQLQHAKASSEASQEQQNMLYAAIWDMETLIEDLKSKVSKAENKTESTEEQCIMLSETNAELNVEITVLRDRVEFLELSLAQTNNAKLASAEELNSRIKLIMDMAMQLAVERERIQRQMQVLTMEKKFLVEKLWNTKKDATECNNEDIDNKELPPFKCTSPNATSIKTSVEDVTDSLDKSFQVDEPSAETPGCDNDAGASSSVYSPAGSDSELDTVEVVQAKRLSLKYVLIVIVVVSVIYLLNQEPFPIEDL